jgi:multicomponent Na+:H+ antiporter subunit A
MLGFVGKELAYEGLYGAPWLLAALIAAGAVLVLVVVLVAWRPSPAVASGRRRRRTRRRRRCWLGPLVLAALGLLFGLAPGFVQDGLMRPAAAAVLGAPYAFDLYLWHGVTLALGLSLLTMSLGVVLVGSWRRWQPALLSRLGGVRGRAARRLRGLLAGGPALRRGADPLRPARRPAPPPDDHRGVRRGAHRRRGTVRGAFDGIACGRRSGRYLYEFLFFAVVLLATATVVRSHSRLVVITSLGVVGFGVAFVFVLFAAPDLAITQFLVDTLVVIIAALVLIRLPSSALRDRRAAATPAGCRPPSRSPAACSSRAC